MKDEHHLLLAEIIEGYSLINDENVEYYFKHPLILDVLKEVLYKREIEKEANIIGLKSEKELLNIAYDSGKWNKENDELISGLEFSIKSKTKFLSKIEDLHIKNNVLSQINEDEIELRKLKNKKASFVLASKEDFIIKKLALFTYNNRIFYDRQFTKPLEKKDLNKCFYQYSNKFLSLYNRDNLLNAVFCNDFFDFFLIYEDLSKIFNKPALELTIFQKNILVYGNSLITKLKNCYKMPSDIKNNPIKIFEWSENDTKSKSLDSEDFNIREKVKRAGGLENMKPEDKIT